MLPKRFTHRELLSAVAASPAEPARVPLEGLEAQICELAGHLAAATCRFLVLLADFDAFVVEGGERLAGHARFEAAQDSSPDSFRYHLFLQWVAARAFAAAQARARAAGMKIGLITDLAVGIDERDVETLGQTPPNRGFAGAHHADQHDRTPLERRHDGGLRGRRTGDLLHDPLGHS